MEKDYGLLRLGDTVKIQKGCFPKGFTPWNKGKKWDDYMSKRKQKKILKATAINLQKRPKVRPDNVERLSRPIIAFDEEGRWCQFLNTVVASERMGGNRRNIHRCAQANEARKPRARKENTINTDHSYLGLRWYFEDDDIWMQKIKEA